MKKVIVTTFALAMMGSSAAFADANKLSAFQGVETNAVSTTELNQVSGEGLLGAALSGVLSGNLLSSVLNGALVGNVLNTVAGLSLLEGASVQSSTALQTGALIGGVTGIQGAFISLGIQ
ncbi:MAG: hypothetical protein ACU836_05530 [Gammaproteobacteria bacterium]